MASEFQIMDDLEELNEIASILLKFAAAPVIFSDDPYALPKWSRTKKRSIPDSPPESSPEPVTKRDLRTVVEDISSYCSDKIHLQSMKKKSLSNPNQSPSTPEIEANMGLYKAQMGTVIQPIVENKDDESQRGQQHLPSLISFDRTVTVTRSDETASLLRHKTKQQRSFDLNDKAAEVQGVFMYTPVEFQRTAAKAEAAAETRKKRVEIMRSKKLSGKFISYQRHET